MKKLIIGLILGLAVVGLLATTSLIHAEEPKAAAPAETQTEKDEAAWEAWRTDFEARLEADEQFLAAEAALGAHEGDDWEEWDRLAAARDDRYREIALAVYEEHFDKWEGDNAEFDGLIVLRGSDSPIAVCGRAAVDTCGVGKICRVTVTWGAEESWSCFFACRDGRGKCPDSPPKKARRTTD